MYLHSSSSMTINPSGPSETIAHRELDGKLQGAMNLLKPIKEKFPTLSFADFYQLAGVIAVEITGGPEITFNPGRQDKPEAPPGKFLCHSSSFCLRDLVGYVGLSDKDIVALHGGHTLENCHNSNGYSIFDNSYFSNLLNFELEEESSSKPRFHDQNMLRDTVFKSYIEKYAECEATFFLDYAEAHQKFSELGFHSHLVVDQLPIFYTFIASCSHVFLAEYMSYVGCIESIYNVKMCAFEYMRTVKRRKSYEMVVNGSTCKCSMVVKDGFYYFVAGDGKTGDDILNFFLNQVMEAFAIHCKEAAKQAENDTTFYNAMGQPLLHLVNDFNCGNYTSREKSACPLESGRVESPHFIIYTMIARRSTSVVLFEYTDGWKPSEVDYSMVCRRRLLEPDLIGHDEGVGDEDYSLWGLERNDLVYIIVSSYAAESCSRGRFLLEEHLESLEKTLQRPFHATELVDMLRGANEKYEEDFSPVFYTLKKLPKEEWAAHDE